jgi:TP901 family phage tail tape measure protein
VQAFNDFEKSVDRLSALTGLTGYQLEWLAEQAKKMSTETIEGGVRITQGADKIVEAFTKVGSARPELLKDKDALQSVTQEAIILSEAAGDELQPAVDALCMVMNQFNAPASEARGSSTCWLPDRKKAPAKTLPDNRLRKGRYGSLGCRHEH